MAIQPLRVGFSIDVQEGNLLDFPADVLVVKDWRLAQRRLDGIVRRRLHEAGAIPDPETWRLGEGDYRLVESGGSFNAAKVLFVGPTDRPLERYTHLRDFAADVLRALKKAGSEDEHVALALQGVFSGLDELESFRSMLLGFGDAYDAGDYPAALKRITFVDRERYRVLLMQTALQEFLPPPAQPIGPERSMKETAAEVGNILAGQQSFAPEYQKPEADENTPHVFVAMPFAEDYDDQFYLAIRPAVEAVNCLCVRLDQDESRFTGDIVDQIKERIKAARLVIALLDGANPNVYLEIGYAWGVGTPTVLVAKKDQALPFDVRGHRCLIYDRIHRLKDALADELRGLIKSAV